ncbi:hypothetical protein L249_0869 [Ophiocordyceps polyrhachis-furcata BCC 54312]|uniref:FAD-binding PCMH-type domain-containing protein n=1 Tax=Ophiocordyceps polyrhachis-furcata BCC 54312 TaxID=1330021 RepID=A0A367LG08_9HYPO|nr:hypothetical protein L249_0869 [Ophiocordyceps polyrhachis-furcata BCC 54312]
MATTLLALFLCLSTLATARPGPHCKAFPGDSNWPSREAWNGLQGTLQGRLLSPAPPGAVCHGDKPTYDPAQCPNVQRLWTSFEFHAQNPLSVLWNMWTGFDCLPDPKAPCTGRGYPAYVVNASETAHVKLAVDFARKHKVRLVVKNTGYDFLGRSTAPGALSIWTLHIKSIQVHPNGQFKLGGSGRTVRGNAVTVGAGTLAIDIYRALDRHGLTFIGPMGPTVGIAGFLSSGGHSNLSGKYGLGADNVLEMELVTPKGEVVVVNEDVHRDLFWALRGGGGSTFGVVTRITMRTYPTPKLVGFHWVAGIAAQDGQASDLAPHLMSKMPDAIDAGLLGWTAVIDNVPNPVSVPGQDMSGQNVSGIYGVNAVMDTNDPAEAHRVLKPIVDAVKASRWNGRARLWLTTTPYPSYIAYVNGVYSPRPGGYGWYEVSRIMDRKAFSGDTERLARALHAVRSNNRGNMFAMTLAGKGVQDVKLPNSVNPGWRAAYALGMTSLTFKPFDPKAETDARQFLDSAWQPMRDLTPELGSNIDEFLDSVWQPMRDLTPELGSNIDEGFPYEKNWRQAFWGNNYARLLLIKRRVDPDDVLWCSPCVGNERWRQSQDGHLCRIR